MQTRPSIRNAALLLSLFGLVALGTACAKRTTAATTSGSAASTVDGALPCPAGPMSPAKWPANRTGERAGAGVSSLADFAATMETPVEVCGVKEQLEWLVGVTCPDGSQTFADLEAAHGSRVGSQGMGGRCGTMIDLYVVPCPSGPVEVHMDLYHCGPGQSLF